MAFFDREVEFEAVVDALRSDRAELVIVYGRRGVGKSELLVRAMEGREGLYYQATDEVMAQQLADIAVEVRRAASGRAIVGQFDSIGAFFVALTDLARAAPDKPFAAVIDEFPYLAEAERGVETARSAVVGQGSRLYTQPQSVPRRFPRVMDARTHAQRTRPDTEQAHQATGNPAP